MYRLLAATHNTTSLVNSHPNPSESSICYQLPGFYFVSCVLKIGVPVVRQHLCVFLTEDCSLAFSIQVLVDNFRVIRYDGEEPSDLYAICKSITSNVHCTHGIMCDVGGSFWEMHTKQLKITLILYKKWILPVEETTSGSRCGSSLAVFSRPASACPSDRVTQGVFLPLERSQRI